jgi:ferredoxin
VSRVRYKLVVDPIACDGAGVCAELLPEMVSLDPWGFPIVYGDELHGDEVPDGLLGLARRATVNCPRLALTLVRLPRA